MVAAWCLLLAMSAPAPASVPRRCVPANVQQLERVVRQTGRSHVVFFATWCAPCRTHVQKANAQTVLVGAFDEAERLERAVARVDPAVPCLLDRGITAALGIHSVPTTVRLTAQGWQR